MTTSRAIVRSFSVMCSSTCDTQSANSSIDMADTSAMFFPPMRNCSASFFRRVPPHTEQRLRTRNCSRHFCPRFDSSSSVRNRYSAIPSHETSRLPPDEANSDMLTVSGSESP